MNDSERRKDKFDKNGRRQQNEAGKKKKREKWIAGTMDLWISGRSGNCRE